MGRVFRHIPGIIFPVAIVILCFCITVGGSKVSADSRLDQLRATLARGDVEAAWNAIGAVPSDLSGLEREETIALLRKTLMRQWPRCTGDIRQTISRKLADLDAREAVPDLLELIRQDRRISHECAE